MSYVCPACAGMIRMPKMIDLINKSLPRMRGDDPFAYGLPLEPVLFAPHARG